MLARLRPTLDFVPSPVEDKPGLMIRDPFQFTNAVLIVPPGLISCLEFFDGQHSLLDLRGYLAPFTGAEAAAIEESMSNALSEAGFLEDDRFFELRDAAQRTFAESDIRAAAHAGSGYPDAADELRSQFSEYMHPQIDAPKRRVLAIAAPHVSPFGGVDAYRAAYSALSPDDADRTFVVLGTSHYGHPDRLGLTRKAFVTPYGQTAPATALVKELETNLGGAALLEDYCHVIEHSIEFQIVFLQHLFGPHIKVLPILCGSYARSIYEGGPPEQDDAVRRIFGTLGDIAAREGDRLLWVLGIDMAHMGQRYGDPFAAEAGKGEMLAIEKRDQDRIAQMESGDARGFWERVQRDHDPLKWCGSAPVYTFLKSVPEARGELLKYQQWNIDESSVVSFAGMRFFR